MKYSRVTTRFIPKLDTKQAPFLLLITTRHIELSLYTSMFIGMTGLCITLVEIDTKEVTIFTRLR